MSSEPIPYVSIGIVNDSNGTISNKHGVFQIDLSCIKENCILRFSCVGFQSIDFNVSSFKKYETKKVILEEKKYLLDEVIITPKKKRSIEFGKLKSHQGGWALAGVSEGFEIARLFNNNKSICLNEVKFHLHSTNYDSILFRVHFYSNNKGFIGEQINKNQILINSKIKKGWVTKNLIPYNIVITGDFFISIEALMGWNSLIQCNEDIRITGGNLYGSIYYKVACMAPWNHYNGQMDYFVSAIIID